MSNFHFHQAIVTKWLSPSHTKGSRIKASAEAGSLTIPWDYSLNVEDNHASAAMALVRKLGWIPENGHYESHWHGGAIPTHKNGYVFVAGGDAVPLKFGSADQ